MTPQIDPGRLAVCAKWLAEYLAFFGVATGQEDWKLRPETVRMWAEQMALDGWSDDELLTALPELKAMPPFKVGSSPKPSQHWQAISDVLTRTRRAAAKVARPERTGPSCDLCCGGHVEVVHPKNVTDGKLTPLFNCAAPAYYTCVVHCRCWQGKAMTDAERSALKPSRPPSMTLDQYEAEVSPHWRDLLVERRTAIDARHALAAENEAADKRAATRPPPKYDLAPAIDQIVGRALAAAPPPVPPALPPSPKPSPAAKPPKPPAKSAGDEYF